MLQVSCGLKHCRRRLRRCAADTMTGGPWHLHNHAIALRHLPADKICAPLASLSDPGVPTNRLHRIQKLAVAPHMNNCNRFAKLNEHTQNMHRKTLIRAAKLIFQL